MINFNVGYKFDKKFSEEIVKLNDKYKEKSKITSVYGSMQSNVLVTARPDFRLQDISFSVFQLHIKYLNDNNIKFKYAFNSPFMGKPNHEIFKYLKSKKDIIKKLIDYGVDEFIIANPLFIEFMLEHFPQTKVEVSTIMHVDNVNHIKFLKKNYPNIKSLVLDVYRNRDIGFVFKMAEMCRIYGIKLEVMCSEACSLGDGVACKGIYRQFCYDRHSSVSSLKDSKMFSCFPQGRCIVSRSKVEIMTFLTNRMIFPNDLEEYSEATNVKSFKVTVRTAPVDFALFVIESYMSLDYDGNIFALWQHIEGNRSIDGKAEVMQKNVEKKVYIDSKKLKKAKFMSKWVNDKNFRCSEFLCTRKQDITRSYDCNWCYLISKKIG